jgi:signal transduction histidine kinase
MTWPAPLVFAHLVTACSAVIGINHVARGPDVPNPLLADIAFAVVFSAVFVVAAVVALRSGRILDLTRNRVYTAAGAAAAEDARLEERFRFDALTHDEVMATLLSAARFDTTAAVQSQASTALNKLDALRSSADDDAELDIESAIAYLRATITTIDPSSEIAAAAEGPGPTSTIPLDAVRTVSAAAAEAVRNSIRHAGADAVRRIEVTVGTTGGLDVRVIDDGIGFDPERVEPHRLGLAISIRERMRQLAGGYARVHSELGSGSVVEVGWKR